MINVYESDEMTSRLSRRRHRTNASSYAPAGLRFIAGDLGVENLVLYKPCLHPDSVAVVPPLRRGGGGVSPRNRSLARGSGTAVLRGIVASAQRTGYAF